MGDESTSGMSNNITLFSSPLVHDLGTICGARCLSWPMGTQSTFGTDVGGSDLLLLSEGFQSWEMSRRLGCRRTLDLSVHQLSYDLGTICCARFVSWPMDTHRAFLGPMLAEVICFFLARDFRVQR